MQAVVQPPTFVSIEHAATRTGVPAAWLRSEADAGRIPHIKAGKRILCNVSAVERALMERATADDSAKKMPPTPHWGRIL